ncbi:MAG: YitT family protein [Bacteroidota bacterium]|nr:YitT family protein [Bacteroidota bacterium]
MNPIWNHIIIQSILRKRKHQSEPEYSSYDEAKGINDVIVTFQQRLKDTVLIICGILSAGFGLKGFLLPSNFIDGGATGISLLVSELSSIPLPLLLVLVNIPFILMGFKLISRSFAIRTILAIIGLAIATATIPYPIVTHDKLLIAVFGGFFLGTGIGLSVRGGAVLDGTEVLAIFISRRLKVTIGDVILIVNLIIFSAAAYLLSIETALYAILTYLSASKTVDFIIEGLEEYTGVTIISMKSEEIRQMIINELEHGVTIYKGRRGFGKHGEPLNNVDILFTVITRLEVRKLSSEIEKIDSDAFVITQSIKDTHGGMIKKRTIKD